MVIQWLDVVRAMSLVMVIEGILPFLSPKRAREMFSRIATVDDRGLRTIGFLCLLSGLLSLQLVHWLT